MESAAADHGLGAQTTPPPTPGSTVSDGQRSRQAFARPPQPVPPSVWMLPDGQQADTDGVVGIGADLTPSTLVDAYRRGIFPWPHPGIPLPWFCPDPRAVIPLDQLHVSRSLRTRLRRSCWVTTVDRAFKEVVVGCADRPRDTGTWITTELARAFQRLHHLGWAHSFEVWDGDRLVGGMYGVQVGAVFTGESMFHRATDASKVALVDAVSRLDAAGAQLLDVQMMTPHLRSMGAVELPRATFLAELEVLTRVDARLCTSPRPVSELAAGCAAG